MANRECLGYNKAGFRCTRVQGHHQSESWNQSSMAPNLPEPETMYPAYQLYTKEVGGWHQEKRQPDHQGGLYLVKIIVCNSYVIDKKRKKNFGNLFFCSPFMIRERI